MATAQLERYPSLRSSVEFRVLDDLSSVAVNPESGEAHALTPVATAIFERCDGTMSIAEIVRDIVDIFECDGAQAEKDVIAFLDDLTVRGLIDW
ncbi:MAG TPA: HPr-rel-A system PqqD family peptide chaperone [Thermomicrobiales bacterium]